MVMAADQHLDRSRAHLRGADNSTRRDGSTKRDIPGLDNGQQVDRKRRWKLPS
jgi:hypothetical protein